MRFEEILNSRFAEPASVFDYKDGALTLIGVNDRLISEQWLNISKDEYSDHVLRGALDERNMKNFMRALEKCVSSGEEQTCETWRTFESGCCGEETICIRSRFVLLEKTGDDTVVCEVVRNITNERRTQDSLADIEHRYKSASEQINIYNWEYTVATKEMRPCYRCMRDLGLPALVENYPEPAIDAGIFPPDYADMYRDMMRQIDAGAKELEADIPLTVGRVPFRVKYTTEFDEAGKPVKAFGSATLISETELGHIKLDNEIIASLAGDYRCLFVTDFIKDTVKVVKTDGSITLSDKARYSELAKLLAELLESNGETESAALLTDVDRIRTELFADFDRREIVYKDKENGRWSRLGFHVMERGNGNVDRLLITQSVMDDMRARKMDDDILIAAQKAELEDRQKLLLNAIEEANRANQAKTVFFSNMSHDIRTPMSAITGFSRLALEELDNRERLEDYLNRIVTAGDHLMSLINDILDMSRIESGKMTLTLSPVRLKTLFEECAEMVRGKMDEKKLNFTVSINELENDTVSCDKLRFRQILLNLLSNAYKFTAEGGSVFLTGRLLSRKGKLRYEIRVKDTGIGMSEEFKDHIWDAYSRESGDTVNEIQGTGLGMAIVNNIVNMMNGTIELKTAPGKGSEFIIILPLEPTDRTEDASQRAAAVSEAMNRRYDGKTVLIVDDTAINLKLCEYVLLKYGFNVLKSTSGVDAVDIVKNSKHGDIDLILMDVKMPVMDGLEATRRIRAISDPVLASIPVIAMTANAFAADVQAALDAGMNAHVPKPFLVEDLITKINSNLK
ncbi:MAG: response regulator [Lachnospiraceae bacterium]|nr:response regulator [Lachnospiraceae bacterium]